MELAVTGVASDAGCLRGVPGFAADERVEAKRGGERAGLGGSYDTWACVLVGVDIGDAAHESCLVCWVYI